MVRKRSTAKKRKNTSPKHMESTGSAVIYHNTSRTSPRRSPQRPAQRSPRRSITSPRRKLS